MEHIPQIVSLTPTRDEVYNRAVDFLTWYRQRLDANVDGNISPVSTHPNRVQVEDIDAATVVERIETCNDEIGQNGPITLVNQTLHNTTVAGNLSSKRRILRDNENEERPRRKRRERFRNMLALIKSRCVERISTTLRSLFYRDKSLFTTTAIVGRTINDVCVRLDCTRNSLYVVAENRGYVIGAIRYMIHGDTAAVDCNTEGNDAKCRVGCQIPPFVDTVTDLYGDGQLVFILFVEKYSVFFELAQIDFHNSYHCILITGKGQADLATRLFLKKLTDELRLPIFCLVDLDVHGIEIYTLMKYGSTNYAYDSKSMACPLMFYLGVSANDLVALEIPSENLEDELTRIAHLLEQDWVRSDARLHYELNKMYEVGEKAPIEAINNIINDCVGRYYVPLKLFYRMHQEMNMQENDYGLLGAAGNLLQG